jgi:hypothetical protein
MRLGNPGLLYNCTDITSGLDLYIPLTYDTLYILQANDTCLSIEIKQNRDLGTVKKYNFWIDYWCDNLQTTTEIHGHTLCLSPQGGIFNTTDPIIAPGPSTGYTSRVISAPAHVTVVDGTTPYCGQCFEVTAAEASCASVCTQNGITLIPPGQ